jgi:NADH-quinone oxidoreductase subunit N
MSVVGAYYYLRVIKLMYFDEPAGERPPAVREAGVRFALGVNAAVVLALGVLPAPLLDLCARLIH